MIAARETNDEVGPVLICGDVADAIVAAIAARHPDVRILPHGSYVRVHAPARCSVSRADVEAALGRPFSLPSDLETVMTSFRGRLVIDTEHAEWTA